MEPRVSIDEMESMLDEAAAALPAEIFKDLNGGILLLPEAKPSPAGRGDDLFILGEYNQGGSMGRYISIYYGSFMRVYGHLGKTDMMEKLTQTLKHEFIHHLESMAGERGLEIKDAEYLADYFRQRGGSGT